VLVGEYKGECGEHEGKRSSTRLTTRGATENNNCSKGMGSGAMERSKRTKIPIWGYWVVSGEKEKKTQCGKQK